MRTLDRYIFRQLLVPVCGAVLALTAIALLSQSLSQFDLVVERGQSGWTFAKVTLLSLPQLAGLILPIALFVGTLVALTRLQGENEITAARAAGEPLTRLASPIIRIAVWFTVISLASNLFLQPWTARAMRQELFRIKNDLVSTLVKEGDFSTSPSGLTIYVQRIDQNGLLRQIFIRTPSVKGHDRTYAAKEGRIKTIDGESILIMRNGSTQALSDKRVLDHGTFDQYSFDITPYFSNDDFLQYKEGDKYMHELVAPNPVLPAMGWTWDRDNAKKRWAEVHARISGPLYNLTFVLLGVVAVLGGRYSRRGYSARIAAAAGIAAFIRIFGVIVETACNDIMVLNILQYLVPAIPVIICLRLLVRHDSLRQSRMTAALNPLRSAA